LATWLKVGCELFFIRFPVWLAVGTHIKCMLPPAPDGTAVFTLVLKHVEGSSGARKRRENRAGGSP